MTNDPTVTQADAVLFLEQAFRNIALPPLDPADIEDIRDGLDQFWRRTAHSGEGRDHPLSRYVQHLPACKLKMRKGGRCDCGLSELRHPSEGRSDGVGEDMDGVFDAALEELDRECRCAAVRGEDGKRVGVAILRKHFGPAMLLARDEFAPLANSALRAQVAALSAPQGEVEREAFRPMSEWDQRDETVLLLVDYSDGAHPLDDSTVAISIGHNNDHNIGSDEAEGWKFAGWCWSHDHYVEGKGTPIGWMPLPHCLAALAESEIGSKR